MRSLRRSPQQREGGLEQGRGIPFSLTSAMRASLGLCPPGRCQWQANWEKSSKGKFSIFFLFFFLRAKSTTCVAKINPKQKAFLLEGKRNT